MQTTDAPSHGAYSHFRCEKAVVVDVNRKTWTVRVQSIHSGKEFPDAPWLAPYAHSAGGEGFHHMPEPGAECYMGIPSDNTPAFVMGYIPSPSKITSSDSDPEKSALSAQGSMTDVSYQTNRPESNPGDIGFTNRDGAFVIASRGGVLRLGSTALAQRICVPVGNYIRDFAQNYELSTFAGDLAWTVEQPELDAKGKAACQWIFHTREFATDKMASVRVRHTPLSDPGGGDKIAWEVTVAPQGIDTETGEATGSVYTLLISMSGDKTEMIGASRDTEVTGDDLLSVGGNANWSIGEKLTLQAKNLEIVIEKLGAIVADKLSLGEVDAVEPGVLGAALVQWFATQQWPVATVGGAQVAAPTPAAIALLQKVLSSKVFLA